MTQQRQERLKPLLDDLPPGYVADAAWLTARGIDRKSILQYERRGWLEKLARGVYSRAWKQLLPSALVREVSLRTSVDAQRINIHDLEVYFHGMSQVEPELFISMLEQAQAHSADDLLPRIDVPTLVIAGGPLAGEPADTIEAVAETIRAGARGVIVGRNIWQRERVVAEKTLAEIASLTRSVSFND